MARQSGANVLWFGDNLEILRDHIPDESVDLVYLDPPFNSNRAFNVIFGKHPYDAEAVAAQVKAFDDTWHWTPLTDQQYQECTSGGLAAAASGALRAFYSLLGETDAMAYLVNMAPRLAELRRVLKPTGSLYLHCDPTMSHYLKLLLDAVFGAANFRNEIVWKRTNARSTGNQFPRVHDVILMYSAGRRAAFYPQYAIADPAKTPHTLISGPDGRKYQTYELTAPGITAEGNSGMPWRGFDPSGMGRHWANSHATMDEWDRAGLIHWPANDGFPRRRSAEPFDRSSRVVTVSDVWTDIDRLNQTAAERIGYPTQKPLALLERIISASSRPGDVVLDPFCGCGTTIDAAQRLGRHWIGIDVAFIAVDIIRRRLSRHYGSSVSYELRGSPRDLAGADALFERDEFEFQTWAVTQLDAEPNEKRTGDKGVDGIANFYIDRRTTGRVIISVKGGRNVKPEHVRELVGTVSTQRAQMGILVMRIEPTPGVRDAASHAGTYTWPLNGQTYPKIQVISIGQLLGGVRPAIPTPIMPYTRRAKTSGIPDAASLLSGRVLIHARVTDIEPLLGLADGTRSGIVLTGTTGVRVAARRRRDREVECPLIFDPAAYETWKATPQAPFRVSTAALQGRALDSFMREMCKSGADAVLTPTGYINAADVASLAAVLDAAPGLNSQAVISLPLDINWLTYEWIDILIEMMAGTPAPKAIMIGDLPSRASTAKEVLANLRLIASEVPQVGLFRTGLAALDMMACGALAGAIGSSSALRKLNPPDEDKFIGKVPAEEPANSPEVLVSELLAYLPGNLLAEQFGDTLGLTCRCRHCAGRRLTRFAGRAEWLDARLHNFAVWTEWLPGLLADATLARRQLSWTRLCLRGIEEYEAFERSAGDPQHGLTPELPLLFWAGLTAMPPRAHAALRQREAGRVASSDNEARTYGAR